MAEATTKVNTTSGTVAAAGSITEPKAPAAPRATATEASPKEDHNKGRHHTAKKHEQTNGQEDDYEDY
ncbi:MAG: hypothetical protein U5Q16_14380 [Gammaproteobacteria bacterium]|nr:hypothetical protein [Gammaproteobacteria bacterium]